MKELSIEEKAKRYDEALEKAQKWYNANTNEGYRSIFENIFPELKESEDERIIKALKEGFKYHQLFNPTFGGIPCIEIVNWLEKQGKQKSIDDLTQQEAMDIAVAKCFDEQKPTDKVEPKFKVKYAGSEYNVIEVKDIAGVAFYGIEDEPNHIDYIQAEHCERVGGYGIKENGCSFPTKPIMFSEKKSQRIVSAETKEAMYSKPAWSEEDDNCLSTIIAEFSKCAGKSVSKDEWMRCNDFLNSLKNKVQPQPKQEWSALDERNLQGVIDEIQANKNNAPDYDLATYDRFLDWLKSLRPQSTWKPSDEQMTALRRMKAAIAGEGEIYKPLNSLYEDLKKLKG